MKEFTMIKHRFRKALLAASLVVLSVGCGRGPIDRTRSAVRINELSSVNGVYQDIFGNTGDWIELYNVSDEDFDLGGCYISDSANKRFKYQFPETQGDAGAKSYIVPARRVLLVFADAQPLESSPIEPHLSFKLTKKGESIWLSDPAGYVIDSVQFSLVPPNDAGTRWTSFARFPDGTGEFEWCSEGTPGEVNGDSCNGDVL